MAAARCRGWAALGFAGVFGVEDRARLIEFVFQLSSILIPTL